MSEKDNNKGHNEEGNEKSQERRFVERRSTSLPEDFVNRRKGGERRKEDIAIDFPDRRQGQRRAPIVGVDFEDRRVDKRRKDKQSKDSES